MAARPPPYDAAVDASLEADASMDAASDLNVSLWDIGPPPPLGAEEAAAIETSFKGRWMLDDKGKLLVPRSSDRDEGKAGAGHARPNFDEHPHAEAHDGEDGTLENPEDHIQYVGDHGELLHSCALADFEELRLLLDDGANARACADGGETDAPLPPPPPARKGGKNDDDVPRGRVGPSRVLHDVVRAGYDPACVTLLASHGGAFALVDRDEGGATALHLAANHNRAEAARALLFDHKANAREAHTSLLMLRDAYGDTPLHVAASKGFADVVGVLLDRGHLSQES